IFEIIETQEDDIFLLVMYPIILEEELLGYIKAISLLDAHIFAIYKKNIYETIVIVNLTIILLVLFIFPIVNKAYRELNERKTALLESNIMMLTTLGDAIALRDSDTNAHNYRVTLYTIKLGQTIGLNNNEMKTLIKGAFLHDIGKIGIQDRILLKPDKLSADEFKLMKEHVIMGSHMVLQNSWLKDANDIILFHHEKYDGSGYPNGFKKDAIPKLARLFTIVDVFDALTSIRPYKNSYSYEESIALLKKGSGTQFDPYYLNQFLSISKDLHQKVYHHSTEELRDILEQLSKQYFSIV
ncbi:MAG TPA: HD domain-containing protein, partial [Epsilonproteobacteria bacterium]|nr:HD domain-containing protein [Campylobacterota bacterium]